jgi:hypothetical protein
MPKHSACIRQALIKLFEEPVPESYKAGRLVLQSILGLNDIPVDRPVLCFTSNLLLTAMAKPGVSPIVWETKPRLATDSKTVLESMEGAGAELLLEFLGTFEHTRIYSVHTLHFSFRLVHTQYKLYIFHIYMYILSAYFFILVHTCTYLVYLCDCPVYTF